MASSPIFPIDKINSALDIALDRIYSSRGTHFWQKPDGEE